MKIEIGEKIRWGCSPVLALYISGVGILESKRKIDGDSGFDYVELTIKQLVNLRNEIDKELENERQTNI